MCYYHVRFGPKATRCRSPCSFSRTGNAIAGVAMSVGREGRLLFIKDDVSGRRFLCHTGAQRSVVPASRVDMLTGGQGPPLEAVHGTPIRTFGTRCLELSFTGQRFSWDFVTAKIAIPLLGADFLCAYGLLVDVKGRRLINAVTFSSYPCTLSGAGFTRLTSMLTGDEEFLQLLAKFPDLTQPTFSSSTVRHGVEHHLSTAGPPVHARARRLDPAKLIIAKAEFENMERLGIIRRSNSPWASPLHNRLHPCISHRNLGVGGARVEITGSSMTQQFRIGIRFHIFKTFLPTCRIAWCFRK